MKILFIILKIKNWIKFTVKFKEDVSIQGQKDRHEGTNESNLQINERA